MIKTCILAIAKNEELFLDEWINYHLNIGFNHIFILDNNPSSEKLKMNNVNVSIIPYNDVEFKIFNIDQCYAYNYAFNYLKLLDYEYVAIIDIDEFFDFKGLTVSEFILKYIVDENLNMAEIMWQTYTDSGIIYESDCKSTVQDTYTELVTKLPIEKYDRLFSNEISWAKPIIKILPELYYDKLPHYPAIKLLNDIYHTKIIDSSIAVLKHYRTKCLETYIKHKIINAKANIANFTNHGKNIVKGYFMFNTITLEKLFAFRILSKKYNYTLSKDDELYIEEQYKQFGSNPNLKVALCCIAKNENLYIKEWINHYINLGFDTIFIYDNNDDNSLSVLLSEFIIRKQVVIIPFKNITEYALQRAYATFYRNYSNKFDWIAIFDCDEFLVLNKHRTIKEYLSETAFIDKDIIKINWRIYTDSNNLFYEDKPVLERFTELYVSTKKTWSHNYQIKSIIRGKMRINLEWTNPHTPNNTNLRACDNCGDDIQIYQYSDTTYTPSNSPMNVNMNYTFSELKHYTTKSLEEYCEKIKRGYPDRLSGHNFDDLSLDRYYEFNQETNDKNLLFKMLMNNDT